MQEEPTAARTGAPRTDRGALAAAGAWVACVAFLVGIVVTVAAWNAGGGTYQTRDGGELVATAKDAPKVHVRDRAVEVVDVGNAPVVLNLAIRPFDADGGGSVMIDTAPLPPGTQLALLWVRRADPGEMHEQVLKLERNRVVPTLLDGNPDWRGQVIAAAIGIKNASGPVLINQVRLRPTSMRAILADMVSDWSYFNGWDGRSINVAFGGRDEQRVYLPAIVALAAIAVPGVWFFNARRRGSRVPIAWCVVPFMAAWLALDLRWQRQLLLQTVETHAAFAHKTLAERHAAMEHPAFLGLVDAALRVLPADPVRIFVTSDFDYFRMRAGYYLYPNNVLAFDWADPGVLHSGDYVLMFLKHDVHFDSAHESLTWSDGRQVPVSALIPGQGQGLYRVR